MSDVPELEKQSIETSTEELVSLLAYQMVELDHGRATVANFDPEDFGEQGEEFVHVLKAAFFNGVAETISALLGVLREEDYVALMAEVEKMVPKVDAHFHEIHQGHDHNEFCPYTEENGAEATVTPLFKQ